MFYEMLFRYLVSLGFTTPDPITWQNITIMVDNGRTVEAVKALREECVKHVEIQVEVPANVPEGSTFTKWVLDNASVPVHTERLCLKEALSIIRWYQGNPNVFN